MHRLLENTWATVAPTGTHTLAVTLTAIPIATPTVIVTATVTIVVTIATEIGILTVATAVTGVTVVAPLPAVDVTHPITGNVKATREAPLGEVALARTLMAHRATEPRALLTRKMVAGGRRGRPSTSVVACTIFSQVVARAKGFKLVQ